jgi:Protein of unknown function (DUF732)
VVDPSSAPAAPPPSADGDSQAYLEALRAADIPTSKSGRAESEAAAAICDQLRRGVDRAELARVVPAMLNTVDPSRSSLVVDLAERHYCRS